MRKFSVPATRTMWQHRASKMEEAGGERDDNSVDMDSVSDFEEDIDAERNGNPKLADALGKVLRMTKKKNKNKTIVLSKAKLHGVNKQIKKETCGFEIEPNLHEQAASVKDEDVKPDVKEDKKTLKKIGLSKHEKLKRGRVIPSVLDREKERTLSRIATKGVVQLFNAVRQQQSSLEQQFKGKKLTESQKEKILKSVNREKFLDVLANYNTSFQKTSDDTTKTEIKDEAIEEEDSEKPKWEVLRNDFMMDAKLKDWDKKEEDEELSS